MVDRNRNWQKVSKKKVFFPGSIINRDLSYRTMFAEYGWNITDSIIDADLVQFTGGADITPRMYGEMRHKKTFFDEERDKEEVLVFAVCKKIKKPMAGICRGGQFLNVMSGGKLYQHSTGHGLQGCHILYDIMEDIQYPVTSTHHQIMIAGEDAIIIGVAKEAETKEKCPLGSIIKVITKNRDRREDVEIVWYPSTNSFCFQPHPELTGFPELRKKYFYYIEKYLL